MIKKQEFPRRQNNQHNSQNSGQRPNRDFNQNREKEPTQNPNKDHSQGKENTQNRSFQRENQPRQNYSYQNSQPRYNRVKPIESVEDIREDISRIEKEIELEIKEIKTMRLGL